MIYLKTLLYILAFHSVDWICGEAFSVSNHSFIFISGWPQSGTSFLQQLLTVSPKISSMVTSCTKKLTKRKCIAINREGQWMIIGNPQDKKWTDLKLIYKPGFMCAVNETLREELQHYLLTQWSQYWDLTQSYLVEKSPQNMIKIPFLRKIFATAKSVKFIIVIKHPITLNTAILSGTDWLYKYNNHTTPTSTNSNSLKYGRSKYYSDSKGRYFINRELLSQEEMKQNIYYFYQMLTLGDNNSSHENNNSSSNQLKKIDCNLGWLPAFEKFYDQQQQQQLQQQQLYTKYTNVSTAASHTANYDRNNNNDIAIIRYEDFVTDARQLCERLFAFILNSNSNSNRSTTDVTEQNKDFQMYKTQICKKYFRAGGSTSSSSSSSSAIPQYMTREKRRKFERPSRKNQGSIGSRSNHRKLIHSSNPSVNDIQNTNKYYNESLTESLFSPSDPNRMPDNSVINNHYYNPRRELRLKLSVNGKEQSSDELLFSTEVVTASIYNRLAAFAQMFEKLTPAEQTLLLSLETRLNKFGYSFLRGKYLLFREPASRDSNLLSRWDLLHGDGHVA